MKNNKLKKFLAKKQSLAKKELFRPKTATAVPLEELEFGLNSVPTEVINFLIENLTQMNIGETKEISLDFLKPNTLMNVRKADNDAYDGQIISGGQILSSFNKRTIPGLGLYLLSVFELYSPIKNNLQAQTLTAPTNQPIPVQAQTPNGQPIIVNVNIQSPTVSQEPPKEQTLSQIQTVPAKKSIKEWILKRKASGGTLIPLDLKKIESITIQCDLCGKDIFSIKKGYNGCFCMGNDKNSDIKLIKTEKKVFLEFPKKWDKDNIELFMKLFYNKLLDKK